MYRSFLSWRYLVARRTNLIGIVGIMVGVGALILILSIMTGFLELSRATVRGSLADVIVSPLHGRGGAPGTAPPTEPEALLANLRARPEVRSAAAHLNWFGMVLLPGRESAITEQILSSSTLAQRSGVHIVGVDVRTDERILHAILGSLMRARGLPWRAPVLQDELTTTELFAALTREPRPLGRVENPLMPFALPTASSSKGLEAPRVIVGDQILASLGLSRGSEIVLATAVPDPRGGELKGSNRTFVVAGSFRSGDNEMDLGRVYVERSELADFLGGGTSFHDVLVKLKDYPKDGRRLAAELRESLADSGLIRGGRYADGEVRTWEEFRGNLLGAIENERVLMMIMLSLVLLVAGFTVFAILSMMVTEKRRDIGILCALGATPKGILDTFLYIAFWDALIGATLGAILGTWGAIEIDALEQRISSLLGVHIFNRDVYLFDHIPSVVEPVWVAAIVLGAFACALSFAAIPALRAARMDPLEALRYE